MKRAGPILLVSSVCVAVVGILALLINKNREPARKAALSLAENLNAEPAADMLRYSSHTYNLQDWLLLTSEGSVHLWQVQFDPEDQLDRWLPQKEKGQVLRILRDIYWGPPPSDADMERVLVVALDPKLEMHRPLSERLLPLLCQRRNKATATQRATVEKRIRYLATSADPADRYSYAKAQTHSDRTDSCMPVLRKLLADPDDRTRGQAVYALGVRNDTSLYPLLLTLLDDPSPHVQRAWNRIHWHYNSPALMARLWKDIDSPRAAIRERALKELAAHSVLLPRKYVPLLRSLVSHPDRELRYTAINQLRKLGDKDIILVIRKELDSPDPGDRMHGLYALWRDNDRASLPRIRQLAADKESGATAKWILKQWDPAYKDELPKALQILQSLGFQGLQH